MFIYLSIVCRHNALGCQGKQHLSVINRVTAWKEEALGLILISLPRSELGRCWTAAGSSSLSPQPHPRVTHGRINDLRVSLRAPGHGYERRSWGYNLCLNVVSLGCQDNFLKRDGDWGLNVLVIIQLMALCCQHLRLGDPERDQTTSQLHYLDHTTLNLHKY